MNGRRVLAKLSALVFGLSICASTTATADGAPQIKIDRWKQVAPDVWVLAAYEFHQRSMPKAYVVVDGKEALAVGAPLALDLAPLETKLGCRVDTVLLTHAHRDSTAAAERLIGEKRTVRAPKLSEPWLSPAGVAKYWADSVVMPIDDPPLKHRRWAQWYYLVPGRGVDGVRFDIDDGDVVRCGKWTVKAVATPGHSPDHTSYLAGAPGRTERFVFCGDAYWSDGHLFTPYTTDWHHQQADGLTAAAESLRRIAALQPTHLCTEHGSVHSVGLDRRLADTAAAIRHAAVAKGYDTWLKSNRYELQIVKLLAPEQVGSATADGNTKPWKKLSPHLYLSGNTYAIASRDGPVLLVDPYHRALPTKLAELKRDHGVGPVEALTISHAHNDHYTGVYAFPDAERPPVWALDKIAEVIEDPDRVRAPYVDPRPVRVARRIHDGEEVAWHEYKLKFHHLPGQTEFAMGLEVELDGRKVLFTGDNFYHRTQYSGSGGWSGHNRGLPRGYSYSIRKIKELQPAWILAAHGGAMEYSDADFTLREFWASGAAIATEVLSHSDNAARLWNPHSITVVPAVKHVRPGDKFEVRIVGQRGLGEAVQIKPYPNEIIVPFAESVPGSGENRFIDHAVKCEVRADAEPGLHAVPLDLEGADHPDCVLVLIVGSKK